MPYSAWLSSVLLHLVLLFLLCLSPSFYRAAEHKTQPVTVMIDLQKMKLADKTNIPAKTQKAEQRLAKVQPKTPPKAPPPKPKPKPTPAPKPIPKPVPKEAAPVKTNPEAPAKPAQPEPDVQAQQKQLQNLLNNIEKRTPKTQATQPKAAENIRSESSLSDHLTFTEIDLISSELRQVWNVDANAQGLENMHFQIRISLNIQGQVTDVEILDQAQYQSNQIFRSVADSARRAIYICDKRGSDSPLRLLARNHPQDYNSWKELILNFNPLNESVF